MHMVATHDPLQNLDFKGITRLPDQFPCSGGYISTKDVLPVFGGPDEVVLNVVGSMTSVAVFHLSSVVA